LSDKYLQESSESGRTRNTTRDNPTITTSLLLFADDLNTLTISRADAIKCYRYGAVPWSKDTASKLNDNKTEFIQLTMPRNNIPNPAPLILDPTTTIAHSSEFRLLGIWLHHSNPNHMQPQKMHKLGAKPLVKHKIDSQPNFLSPRAGAAPRLSSVVMRTSIEQTMLFSAGVATVDTNFATSMLARSCKIALGAHVSSNSQRALDYCGVPTAAATQLKLQLSLIYKSHLFRPLILGELRRAPHADDHAGLTWRSNVAKSLCSLHPAAPQVNRDAWAWDLMANALASHTWQEQVLDPIAHLLFPKPHPAHRFAGADSAATWLFFNNRFVLVFNVDLRCPLCFGHELTPHAMLNECTDGVVVALRTYLQPFLYYTDRARSLISRQHYSALVISAILHPDSKVVDVSTHMPKPEKQSAREYQLDIDHVTSCVVRHSASVHSRIWDLVKDHVKANALRSPSSSCQCRAAATRGARRRISRAYLCSPCPCPAARPRSLPCSCPLRVLCPSSAPCRAPCLADCCRHR
jgi:hypothetical protein